MAETQISTCAQCYNKINAESRDFRRCDFCPRFIHDACATLHNAFHNYSLLPELRESFLVSAQNQKNDISCMSTGNNDVAHGGNNIGITSHISQISNTQESKSTDENITVASVYNLILSYFDHIKSEFDYLKKEINSLKQQYTITSNIVKKNYNDIKSLQESSVEHEKQLLEVFERVKTLENNCTKLPLNKLPSSTQSSHISHYSQTSVPTNELVDRMSRINNIIILKLKENNLQNDKKLLFDTLKKNKINIGSVSCTRLGSSGNSRPLLVKFSNREDACKFLRNKELHPQNCIVTLDRTKYQRAKLSKLRLEMIKHNQLFPDNKKIVKFIDGEPILVDKTYQESDLQLSDNSKDDGNSLTELKPQSYNEVQEIEKINGSTEVHDRSYSVSHGINLNSDSNSSLQVIGTARKRKNRKPKSTKLSKRKRRTK